MDKLKVAIVQMDVKLGESQVNLQRMEELVRKAAEGEPDVVVLPETWNTGYFPQNVAEQAHQSGEDSLNRLAQLAKELKIYLVGGSISNLENGETVNTAKVYNRLGEEVASYNKIHLFSPGKEHEFYKEGTQAVTFEIEGHKCGLIICYDLRFPELTRRMALDGIEILFVPAEWPHPRLDHWRTLQKARAIENQIFVVTCNGVGAGNGIKFCGHSSAINPWGEILIEGEEKEEILQAVLDTGLVQEVRTRIPVFIDRRYPNYSLF